VILGNDKKLIADMSNQIDKILHGDNSINIHLFKEGELYILQDQINKMTIRLREQNDILKKDKMYLSDSLADIAHQLRTPMTSLQMLMTFIRNAEQDIQNPHCTCSCCTLRQIEKIKQNEFIREAEKLLSRMDWLLSTLLKISKIDAGTAVFKKEKVNIKSLIKKAAEPLAIPLELREIKLAVTCNDDDYFTGDINWTSEAIGNILNNCMKYTKDIIIIKCRSNTVYTEVVISDNGNGISAADLPHIFERFYRGENYSENKDDNNKFCQLDSGYGIGLALCRMILFKQNATIKAESNRKGTKFIIRFINLQ
jgi:signal transduction histidine kinase